MKNEEFKHCLEEREFVSRRLEEYVADSTFATGNKASETDSNGNKNRLVQN